MPASGFDSNRTLSTNARINWMPRPRSAETSAARLVRTEGVWQFREPISEPVPVPASIRALVDARAHALSPDGLRLLHAAAVIGRDFIWPR